MTEPTAGPTDGQIRLRAYYIWQWLGGPEGYEAEIWSRAESELRAEAAKASSRGVSAAQAPETAPTDRDVADTSSREP